MARLLGRRTAELHWRWPADRRPGLRAPSPVTAADLDGLARRRPATRHGRGICGAGAAPHVGATRPSPLRSTACWPYAREHRATAGRDPLRHRPGLVKTRAPRRLSPGPGPGRQGRRHDPRFRGRAQPAAGRTPRQGHCRLRTSPACCARSTRPPGPACSASPRATRSPFDQLLAPALAWRDLRAQAAFMAEYRAVIGGCPSWPDDRHGADRLLRMFLLRQLFDELGARGADAASVAAHIAARHSSAVRLRVLFPAAGRRQGQAAQLSQGARADGFVSSSPRRTRRRARHGAAVRPDPRRWWRPQRPATRPATRTGRIRISLVDRETFALRTRARCACPP